MPLDGFKILDWASLIFGGLPAIVIGGLGLAVLVTGITLMIVGAKGVPASWGLIIAGGAAAVLTYFIVGAAIAHSGGDLAGGEQVAGAAPRVVPITMATMIFGLAMHGGRTALRSWASEEGSGKFAGAVIALVALGFVFLGVQVLRGSYADIQRPMPAETVQEDNQPEPEPIRRGVTAPRRH